MYVQALIRNAPIYLSFPGSFVHIVSFHCVSSNGFTDTPKLDHNSVIRIILCFRLSAVSSPAQIASAAYIFMYYTSKKEEKIERKKEEKEEKKIATLVDVPSI